MSSYPPTPSFGMSFPPPPPHPPPAAASHDPHPDYRQTRAHTRNHGRGPIMPASNAFSGAPSTGIANAFQHNANLPAVNMQGLHNRSHVQGMQHFHNMQNLPPSVPPYFSTSGQFSNGRLPPPPFPPVPIPTQPIVPPPPSQIAALPSFYQTASHVPLPPPFKVDGRGSKPSSNLANPNLADIREREEGELSDVDGDRDAQARSQPSRPDLYSLPAIPGHSEDKVIVSDESRHQRAQDYRPAAWNDARAGGASVHAGSLTGERPNDDSDVSPRQPFTSDNSRDAQWPRRLSTRAHDENKHVDEEAPLRYSPTIGKSATEIRKLAKNAILNLHPFNIRFAEFVAEGVSEVVVKELFEELRLKYPAQASGRPSLPRQHLVERAPPSPVDPKHHADATRADPAMDNAGNQSKPVTSLETTRSDATVSSALSIDVPAPSQSAQAEADLPAAKSTKPLAEAASTQTAKRPSVTISMGRLGLQLSKQAQSRSGSVQLERKDLIAQKLAARSGKVQAPSTQTEVGETASASGADTSTAQSKTGVTVETSHALAKPSTLQSTDQADAEKLKHTALAHTGPTQQQVPAQEVVMDKTALIRQRLTTLQQTGVINGRTSSQATNPESSKDLLTQNKPPPFDPPTSDSTERRGQNGSNSTSTATSGIPGLFMATLPASNIDMSSMQDLQTTSTNNHQEEQQQVNRRKRPVAADFDDEPLPVLETFKRPFGQSRVEQPLVIDVSDDEFGDDYDSGDDISDANNALPPPSGLDSHQGTPKRGAVRDMPPLPDFPSHRKSYTKSNNSGTASAVNTPTGMQVAGSGKSAAQDILKRKEEQIQLMQRKIAELEQRKAKTGGSGAHTPGIPSRTPSATRPSQSPGESKQDETAVDIDRLIDDTHRQVEEDKMDLAEAKAEVQAVEAKVAKALMATEQAAKVELAEVERLRVKHAKAEQLRQRRAELQSRLLRSDAKVELEKKRLEEIQREREEREAVVQQALATKLKLVKELESLGVEASEELADELEAKKKEIQELRKPVGDSTQGTSSIRQDMPPSVVLDPTQISSNQTRPDSRPVQNDEKSEESAVAESAGPTKAPIVGAKLSAGMDRASWGLSGMSSRTTESAEEGEVTDGSEHLAAQEHIPRTSADQMDQSEASDVVMADADEPEPELEPRQSAEDLAEPHAAAGTYPADNQHVGALAVASQDKTQHHGDKYREGAPSADDTDSDSYEPPEDSSPAFHDQVPHQSPPFSPALSPESPPFSPAPPESVVQAVPSSVTTSRPDMTKTDDQVDTDGAVAWPLAAEHSIEMAKDSDTQRRKYHKPYESSLKRFRSYRYHPKYLSEVAGGFASLTYSHNIQAHAELCRYEASGGICNDDRCNGQHFRDMGLSDEMILVQLGSVNEGTNEEEKAEYTKGLERTLQELRARRIKDFTTVASAIIAYRSAFLEDASRVLILEAGDHT